MTDQDVLYRGLSHASWGYFFLNFDSNLGTVSATPRFVGFLLLLSAINKLSGQRKDLALLRPLAVLMVAWTGADWLVSWFGGHVEGHILFLDLLVAAAGLYFHFQFLTDMAALARQYQPAGYGLDRRIRNCRTVYVVVYTAVALFANFVPELDGNWRQYAMLAGAVVAVSATLTVMFALFALRRRVKDGEPEE